MEKTLNGLETEYISAVFGAFDENIEIIENECNVMDSEPRRYGLCDGRAGECRVCRKDAEESF